MDKIIEVKVNGSYLTRDSQWAGVQGEVNSTALRIEFDPGWDGMAKTITWWNAKGEDEVKRILTADQLEELEEACRVYLSPIPGEAMAVAGKCRFIIDGYINGKRQRSAGGDLVVKPDGSYADSLVDSPTPTQAEQLQVQIEALVGVVATERDRAEKAADAAEDSEKIAVDAAEEATEIVVGVRDVAEYAGRLTERLENFDLNMDEVERNALLSESYAHGGTGIREGEDFDNAKYYMENAHDIAVGDFATQAYVQSSMQHEFRYGTFDFDCGTF